MERLNAYRGRNDPKAASGFEKDRVVLARGVRIDQIASLCPSLHLQIQGAHLHRSFCLLIVLRQYWRPLQKQLVVGAGECPERRAAIGVLKIAVRRRLCRRVRLNVSVPILKLKKGRSL